MPVTNSFKSWKVKSLQRRTVGIQIRQKLWNWNNEKKQEAQKTKGREIRGEDFIHGVQGSHHNSFTRYSNIIIKDFICNWCMP